MTDVGPADFFADSPAGLVIFEQIARSIAELGEVETRVTKSQIAFRRDVAFAFVWRPGRYVRSSVPVVLSIALPTRLDSPRFKEVAHPSPKVWMHHLEVDDVSQVDDEVRGWLSQAWGHAAR